MRRKIGILVFAFVLLLCAGALADVKIDMKHFPDAVFREYVQRFDSNSDGTLDDKEIKRVHQVECDGLSISDLSGLEYFTSMTELICDRNQLTKLDVSKNAALKKLYCRSNRIASLDVSKNSALEFLDCESNQLRKLDISKNDKLTAVFCFDNKLTKLKIGRNPALEMVFCHKNFLTTVDVSKCKFIADAVRTSERIPFISFGAECDAFGGIIRLAIDRNVTVVAGDYISMPALSDNDLSRAKITLSQDEYVYDGEAKKPKVTVEMKGETLKKNKDYTVMYSSNVNPGTANVKVVGKGEYTGEKTLQFKIGTISAVFDEKEKWIGTGDHAGSCPINATIRAKNCKIGEVWIETDGIDETYLEYDFSEEGSTEIRIEDHSFFTINTTLKPWNNPGTYTLRLYAKNSEGDGGKSVLATMKVYLLDLFIDAPAQIKPGETFVARVVLNTDEVQMKKLYWKVDDSSVISCRGMDRSGAPLEDLQSGEIILHRFRTYAEGKTKIYAYTPDKAVCAEKTIIVNNENTDYYALLITEGKFAEYDKDEDKYFYHEDKWFTNTSQKFISLLGNVEGPKGGKYRIQQGKTSDVSKQSIKELIQKTFSKAKEGDVCLFYIGTHGDTGNDGRLLMPYLNESHKKEDLKKFLDSDDAWLSFETLANWLTQYTKGEVIVIIESCGAGSAIYSMQTEYEEKIEISAKAEDSHRIASLAKRAFSFVDHSLINSKTGELRSPNKFYVLAASKHGETSYAYENVGALTTWMIRGIGKKGNSPADKDKNNMITLNELFQYIKSVEYDQHVQCYPVNSNYELFTFE